MNDLLKSAIADAKAIKDTAMQNAKATLEESIFYKVSPLLESNHENEEEKDVKEKFDPSIFNKKKSDRQMESEETDDEEEEVEEAYDGEEDDKEQENEKLSEEKTKIEEEKSSSEVYMYNA
jgi:hypothetical protein